MRRRPGIGQQSGWGQSILSGFGVRGFDRSSALAFKNCSGQDPGREDAMGLYAMLFEVGFKVNRQQARRPAKNVPRWMSILGVDLFFHGSNTTFIHSRNVTSRP